MRFLILFLFTINVFSNQIAIKTIYLCSETPACLKNYSNANYTLKIKNKNKIEVKVNYAPLKIPSPYPFEIKERRLITLIEKNKSNSEELILFAHEIKQKSKGYYQCVDNVLNFVSKNFKYSNTINPPLKGDCNTAALTTVKLLALCNIPARIRYVIKFENTKKTTISGKSLHAIVEIYYPRYGWAFSDPVKYHHFVPSTYLLICNSQTLLGTTFKIKNNLTKKGFTDILKKKTIVYKLPNLFRFY
ncbi:hypothetical protein TTHT_0620 [Thermotomaculum hydrothermale]|uniref:Transglutaminase-like domain-containing protein n=1 Tax=Thermotomaculum hydrothermale TaxID=981385 RepID=A0A7R6PPX8_9BACT|nr:transglutaminase-like domain-containing protein [Thermotomaculum hydrothermale]BBB32201.1 hypothetical protein TTHT_0620 [Thermotomaculum hydrothermale]